MARTALSGHALEVAPSLLGAVLVVGDRAGRIVEVEAYGGSDDPASHAHKGPTARNRSMFAGPGTLYCYRSHGIHTCANVVTGPVGDPQAVLVRAIEPIAGIDAMWVDRPAATRLADLGNGPGKLCDALGIRMVHDGVDLCVADSPVRLVRRPRSWAVPVQVTARVGISRAVGRPWRFLATGSPYVSKGRRPGGSTGRGAGV